MITCLVLRKEKIWLLLAFLILIALVIPASLQGQEPVPPDTTVGEVTSTVAGLPTDQIIIKFKNPELAADVLVFDTDQLMVRLSLAAGVNLAFVRPMSGEANVFKLPELLPLAEVEAISANLSALPEVSYAEPDRVVQIIGRPQLSLVAADVTPNDPRFGEQWHYGYTAGTFEGLNLLPAWDITTGSPSVVIAVIDTGILNHADLSGRFLAGYDFITDVQAANDGDGRDPDPSDPGDWVTLNECPERPAPRNSSWHGTHVAGTIGASTNNSLGVAGVNWISKILPVRVLGKCGGITSDLVDAMRWSAGLTVAGVPTNTVPAQVLNLSLTGSGDCSVSEQDAIDDIVNAGATVVVAAGNSNLDAAGYSPGNCDNVITVAANDRPGDKAAYSNFGDKIEVTAPGNFVLSTWNSGLTTPDADAYAYFQGTSMAAPHVAGLVSLIKGLRPDFWPAQILTRLESTARPFPPGSSCLSQGCGSGIVDAFLALDSLDILTEQFYMPVAIYSGQQPAK